MLRGAPKRSETLRGAPRRSEALRSAPKRWRSEALRSAPRRSEALRGAPKRSEALRSAPRRSEALRSAPRRSEFRSLQKTIRRIANFKKACNVYPKTIEISKDQVKNNVKFARKTLKISKDQRHFENHHAPHCSHSALNLKKRGFP